MKCVGSKVIVIKMSRIYLFVIMAKHGNTLHCEELVVCVYIFIYRQTHTHTHTHPPTHTHTHIYIYIHEPTQINATVR